MPEKLDIQSCQFDIQASIFGIYNRCIYYVDFEGNVGMNRLIDPLESYFSSRKETRKPFSSLLANDKFEVVASLNSFPFDSIDFGRKLYISTSDSVHILPFSSKVKNSEQIEPLPIRNVISFAKSGSFLFLSCDGEGLTILDNDSSQPYHTQFPSTEVKVSGNTILNLHPDNAPTVFKKFYFRSTREDVQPVIAVSRASLISDDKSANKKLADSKITGRQILYPFVSDKEVILYRNNRSSFRVDVKNNSERKEDKENNLIESELSDVAASRTMKDSESPRIHINRRTDYQRYILLDKILNTEKREYPVEILEHEEGYVVQYWDYVDFIDFEGRRYNLVKDTEISRIKIFPSYSVYSSYLTIATETKCWIFRIKSDSEKAPRHHFNPLRKRIG